MIIRISIGFFEPERTAEVAQMLSGSEASLRTAIQVLKGNLAYYVTTDPRTGSMTNISHWETLEDAMQMATLPEMLALRSKFESLGINFIKITNHEILWKV